MGIVSTSANLVQTRATQLSAWRLSAIAQKGAVYATYALFVVLPLAYSPVTYDLFDLPKVIALRLLTLAALLALAIAALATGRVSIGRTPLDLPLLIYVAVMVAATVHSVSPTISLNGEYLRFDGLYTIVNYVILYLLAGHLLGRNQVRRALAAMALTAVVVALVAVVEGTGRNVLPMGMQGLALFAGRVSSTFGNPDFLGTYLVLATPVALGLFLAGDSRRARAGWAAAVVLLALALVLTYTRGAWVGFAAGLPVFLIEWRRLTRSIPWLAGMLVAIALGVVLVGAVRVATPAGEGPLPVGAAPEAGEAPAGSAESSIAGRLSSATDLSGGTVAVRLQIWQSALPLVAENPVLGTGLNTFHAVISKHLIPAYAAGEGMDHDPDRAHNNYLQLAVTTGLLGLGAYLVLLGAFALMMLRWLRREGQSTARVLGVAILAAWFGYLVQDFFLFGVVGTTSQWWLLAGLAAALCRSELQRARLDLYLRWPLVLRSLAGAAALLVVLYVAVGAIRMWQADYAFMEGRRAFHSERAIADPEVGLRYYREALALAPQNQYYHEVYATAMGAIVQREDRSGGQDVPRRGAYLDEAVRVMTAAINVNPQFAALYLRRGAIYELYGDDHQMDALNDYRRAVSLYPYSYSGNLQLAHLARRANLPGEAIGAQRALLALFPQEQMIAITLAVDYVAAKRFAEAQQLLEGVLLLNPSDLDARSTLALAFEGEGQTERAMAEYRAVLEADPKNEQARAGIERLERGEPASPHPTMGGVPVGH